MVLCYFIGGIVNGRKEITYKKTKHGCMECTSHFAIDTYPKIQINKKRMAISRYLYTKKHGQIPRGMEIRHTCDNPACININHLVLGTHKDNMDDRDRRNRQAVGGKINTCKLTKKMVLEIRKLKGVMPSRAIALKFGVSSHNTINCILNRKTWKHI